MDSWPVRNPQVDTPPRLPQLAAPPAWLPGTTRVQVVGEAVGRDAVEQAARSAADGSCTGVFVPAPPFADQPESVAVYVQSHHVGYLAKNIAWRAHPALLRFAWANGGRLPACPATVDGGERKRRVELLFDPEPLELPPELFDPPSAFAADTEDLLRRLDHPPPRLTGQHRGARSVLAQLERSCEAIDAVCEPDRQVWPRLERAVRHVLNKLVRASDPLASRGWLCLARTTRHQLGRRDDTLYAYVEALYCDRSNVEAAAELVEYVRAANRGAPAPVREL